MPLRAVRRLDGYCNSGLTLLYSNHLGVERLVPYAKMQFPGISANREVQLGLAPANDDDAPLMSSADAANGDGVLSCWSDEELFKPTPPRDECPICLLTLPLDGKEVIYQECCGKILCGGCFYEESTENNIRVLCPFSLGGKNSLRLDCNAQS